MVENNSVDFRGALWYLFVLTKAQGGGNMSDIISDLYYGELRPNEREYLEGVEAEVLLESFKQDEAWLTEHLEGAGASAGAGQLPRRAGRPHGLRELPLWLPPGSQAHHGGQLGRERS